MPIDLGSILLLLHVIFFCFWIGTDIGVFYSSRYVVRTDIGLEARATALKIMTFLDQIPRVSGVGILVVGATLAILRGYLDISQLWILPIWLVGSAWAAGIIYLYVTRQQPAKGEAVRQADLVLRLVLICLTGYVGVSSLLGNGVSTMGWFSVKLLVFAAILLCGVYIRISMKTFGAVFGPMMQGQATPEQMRTAQTMMAGTKRVVLVIYALLIVAAALGLWKPF